MWDGLAEGMPELCGGMCDISFPEHLSERGKAYFIKSIQAQYAMTEDNITVMCEGQSSEQIEKRIEDDCKSLSPFLRPSSFAEKTDNDAIYENRFEHYYSLGTGSIIQAYNDALFLQATLKYCERNQTVSDIGLYDYLYKTIHPDWMDDADDVYPDIMKTAGIEPLTAEDFENRKPEYEDYDPEKSILEEKIAEAIFSSVSIPGKVTRLDRALEMELDNTSLLDIFEIYRIAQHDLFTPYERQSLLYQAEDFGSVYLASCASRLKLPEYSLMELAEASAKRLLLQKAELDKQPYYQDNTAVRFSFCAGMKGTFEQLQFCLFSSLQGDDEIQDLALLLDETPELYERLSLKDYRTYYKENKKNDRLGILNTPSDYKNDWGGEHLGCISFTNRFYAEMSDNGKDSFDKAVRCVFARAAKDIGVTADIPALQAFLKPDLSHSLVMD